MIELLFSLTLLIAVLVMIFCIDDLFIDFIALIKNLKPIKISKEFHQRLNDKPQKKIAIMIANWHEDEILERMIAGNHGRIDYSNYDIYLGVYPNDLPTLNVANQIQSKYSNVFVVINPMAGPTSKGQMLNEIIRDIRIRELRLQQAYDLFMLHDSEDIIHPLSLKLINDSMDTNDFIQIPVFCLPSSSFQFTRCTYIDEFTESHSKDMLVRSHLKAAVPSAGVGTAMSRQFVSKMLSLQHGELMKEDTLTEDYHLGIMAHRLGFNSEFLCYYQELDGRKDFIATREFFPSVVQFSIRQKTRWTLGITLQGFKNLGWGKNALENYFLWRDRRGLINAPLLIASYLLFLVIGIFVLLNGSWPNYIQNSELLKNIFIFNFASLLLKIVQRMRLVGSINGSHMIPTVPIRWVLANYINVMAALYAFAAYRRSLKTGERPKWVKTTHELPTDFGISTTVNSRQPNRPMEISI